MTYLKVGCRNRPVFFHPFSFGCPTNRWVTLRAAEVPALTLLYGKVGMQPGLLRDQLSRSEAPQSPVRYPIGDGVEEVLVINIGRGGAAVSCRP